MEYLTVREIAEKWGVSQRMVQRLCVDGRISGARKFTRIWAIPADAEKPQDHRFAQPKPPGLPMDSGNLMPLMNTAFAPGHCLTAAEEMEEGTRRDIAMAEYHYFKGKPEITAKEMEPYLVSEDMGARLSACLLSAYANLSLGRIQRARFALQELNTALISCPPDCEPLPCMYLPTIVIFREIMDPAPALWRERWLWEPSAIPYLPSICIWWR